jgi:hypothetical protein
MNHPGRPITLTQRHIDIAQQYLEDMKTIRQNDIPFVEELAIEMDTFRNNLYRWMELKQDDTPELKEIKVGLCDTIGKIFALQELRLQQKGLYKEVDTRMATLILQARHEWKVTNVQEQKDISSDLDNIDKSNYEQFRPPTQVESVATEQPVQGKE